MTAPNPNITELESLLWQMRDGVIGDDGISRIETLVTGDAEVRRYYIRYGALCGGLRWLNADSEVDRGSEFGIQVSDFEKQEHSSPFPPSATDFSPFPPLSPLPSSLPSPFVGGPVFSYMVATVVLCMMLLSAWAYKITHNPQQFAVPSSPLHSTERPEFVSVGQVTDMRDCVWKDDSTATIAGASIRLGRKYSLADGLMEITYNSGAVVILEGPCDYEVDSQAGGRLQFGKLVARVGKKVASGQWLTAGKKGRGERGERRGNNGVAGNQPREIAGEDVASKSQAASHQPLATGSSSLVPHPSSLFTVTTPTAVVTDLGTEFGVEVSENGDTISHVFQGTVRVDVVVGKAMESVVLHKDESARVVADENGVRISQTENNFTPPTFVRRVHVIPNQIDLLDIVAGGDGVGSRRERGIDPASGMEDTVFVVGSRGGGDQIYHRVGWHSMIDGVFVPDGGEDATQVDSSGGAFDGFPSTAGEVSYSIWARAADVKKQHNDFAANRSMWIYHILRGEQYMPEGLGLLAMHSNAGITFNLQAIRSRHGATPVAFRATAALADRPPTEGGWVDVWKIDVWVIVDGNLKFKREGLRMEDGPVDVNVELGPNDRFLTLAVTDHDRDRRSDCGIFGDPVLEMKPTP